MRVLMLEAPDDLLEDRRRKGLDRFDEVWEGVLHMVPFPVNRHQVFESNLLVVLAPHAEGRGLIITANTGLYLAKNNYRGPDLVVTRPKHRTRRGVEGGAELVVEILSPGDESREKLPFYEKFGVREALYVHPETRAFEFFVRRAGRLRKKKPDRSGRVRCAALGVAFRKTKGPRFEISWEGGSATI